MKKTPISLLVLVLASFLSFALDCFSGNTIELGKSNFVSQNGKLSVQGTSLVNQAGKPIVLRGVSLGWHNWWDRFYNENTVAWLNKDWNCNLIRAAIGVDPQKGYIKHPNFAMSCLTAVVDGAINKGMYVIIDWHSHYIRLEEAKAFFAVVAQQYKNYPNVIYEIYNEPINDSWNEVKAYSEQIIKTIRSIDKHNIILVGSPHWDQDIHLAADNPIAGYENIMYTLHFYAATHKQELRDRANYALHKNLPIFVSECAGMNADGNGAIDIDEWDKWKVWMNLNHISWAAWSISNKKETCSMIKSKKSPTAGWSNNDLKEWGKIIRKTLQEENQIIDIK